MIERFVPGRGGVENVAWQVAHELARQGEDVTVLTRESAAPPSAARFDGLRRSVDVDGDGNAPGNPDRVPSVRAVPAPTFWQPLRVLSFSKRTADITRRERFDVVHGFARTRQQDLYRAGGGSHADYLRRNHSGIAHAVRKLSPRHRTLLAIEQSVFRDPRQRIQCASQLVAETLVTQCGVDRARILLLPNAVDAERYSSPEAIRDGDHLRRSLGKDAERIWLLPGSGWHRKGLDPLLAAARHLDDPDLRLWIAGRDRIGPWRARAQALGLADRVDFLGERTDMPAVYQAVDGIVLPTRYDPFANVTFEAAAAGKPIITTAANGAAEWLAEDLEILPRADDSTALASALDGFREAARRRDQGERLRIRVRGFDWPSHVARLREEYQKILAGRGREAFGTGA